MRHQVLAAIDSAALRMADLVVVDTEENLGSTTRPSDQSVFTPVAAVRDWRAARSGTRTRASGTAFTAPAGSIPAPADGPDFLGRLISVTGHHRVRFTSPVIRARTSASAIQSGPE